MRKIKIFFMRKLFKKVKRIFNRINNGQLYFSGDYYLSSLRRYDDLDTYLYLFKKKNNQHDLYTDKEICFSSKLKFGSSIKEFKSEISSQRPKVTKKTALGFDVFVYKIKVGGHRAKLEVHFSQDKLFYFSYTFRKVYTQDTKEIVDVLCMKYLNTSNSDYSNNSIIDNFKNRIEIIEDGAKLKINYLSADIDFLYSAKDEMDMKIDKLNRKEIYSKL